MKKLLFIINPVAGRRNAKTAMFDVVKVFCEENYEVTSTITLYKNHGKELAANAAERGHELVVCIGGDGTLNEVISGLMTTPDPLPLGYIASGSTNDFARTLGLNPVPARAARNIMFKRPSKLDVGSYENGERYFSYIASFGAFTSTSYSTPQAAKNNLGHFAYVLEGLKDLPNIKSYNVQVKANGLVYEDEYIFGAVTNSRSMGGVIKLEDAKVDLSDGLFEVMLLKTPKDALDMTDILIALSNGTPEDSRMFEYFKASELEFHMPRGVHWTLDGEKAPAKRVVHIENIPRAITMYI